VSAAHKLPPSPIGTQRHRSVLPIYSISPVNGCTLQLSAVAVFSIAHLPCCPSTRWCTNLQADAASPQGVPASHTGKSVLLALSHCKGASLQQLKNVASRQMQLPAAHELHMPAVDHRDLCSWSQIHQTKLGCPIDARSLFQALPRGSTCAPDDMYSVRSSGCIQSCDQHLLKHPDAHTLRGA
jgi:hypothetical protein